MRAEFNHRSYRTAPRFQIMLSFYMMVPPKVRAALGGRPIDATEMVQAEAACVEIAIPLL